jgi:hypothetical protein
VLPVDEEAIAKYSEETKTFMVLCGSPLERTKSERNSESQKEGINNIWQLLY